MYATPMKKLFSLNYRPGSEATKLEKELLACLKVYKTWNGMRDNIFQIKIEPVLRQPEDLQITVYGLLPAGQAIEAAWFCIGWVARAGLDFEAPRPGY